jgi:hypothetical protein
MANINWSHYYSGMEMYYKIPHLPQGENLMCSKLITRIKQFCKDFGFTFVNEEIQRPVKVLPESPTVQMHL